MKKELSKMTNEELWALFPIILSEYNPLWIDWYEEEKINLEQLIGVKNIARINHYGSTAVPKLKAKPTIDILLEINREADIYKVEDVLSPDYICQLRNIPNDPLMFYKGYTPFGFAEKVYHIHVRHLGDWDELYFRDYLIKYPAIANEYTALKCRLFNDFEHDRDGYTDGKSEFIKKYSEKARQEFKEKYKP